MLGADNFIYNQQNFEGELKYVLRFIIKSFESIVLENDTVSNRETRITGHLVEKYLKNRRFQRQNDFEGYLFDREVAAGVDENYEDTGYLDIKVSMQHTFQDPDAVFTIECKRLDSTKNLNRKYVEEGMMRFITMKYPSRLGANAMLGFCVSSFDCNQNVDNINKIISAEFPQSNTIKAITPYSLVNTFSASYSSEHQYTSENPANKVVLYHLMLDYSSLLKVTHDANGQSS